MALLAVTAGDEASLRTVTAGAVAGDVVAVPSGTYALTATWTVTAGVTIQPSLAVAGAAGPVNVTVNAARHGLVIDNSAATVNRLTLRGIRLTGSGGATLDGISFVGTAGKKLTNCLIEGCDLSGWRNGISLVAADVGSGAGVYVEVRGCDVSTNRVRGMHLTNLSMCAVRRCEMNGNGANGLYAQSCINFSLHESASEGNNTLNGTTLEGDAQVLIKTCHAFTVGALDVESMPTAVGTCKVGLAVANCYGGAVIGYNVAQTAYQPDSVGLRLSNGSRAVRLDQMTYSYITTPIALDASSVFPEVSLRTVVQVAPSTLTLDGLQA